MEGSCWLLAAQVVRHVFQGDGLVGLEGSVVGCEERSLVGAIWSHTRNRSGHFRATLSCVVLKILVLLSIPVMKAPLETVLHGCSLPIAQHGCLVAAASHGGVHHVGVLRAHLLDWLLAHFELVLLVVFIIIISCVALLNIGAVVGRHQDWVACGGLHEGRSPGSNVGFATLVGLRLKQVFAALHGPILRVILR